MLEPLGWDARVAAGYAALVGDDTTDLVPGRVVRVDRGSVIVTTEHGDRRAIAESQPAVGDWVAIELVDGNDDDARVRGVVERFSELARRDPERGVAQVLAANVDLVLIAAPGDRPNLGRVERETVLAWDSGARPVVVITKADVAGSDVADDLRRRLVGVDVLETSTVQRAGITQVAELIAPNLTAVMLGPSGAGKSTLVNALLGEERFSTGDVRVSDSRGRHTTTSRELVVLPTGGVLIDTPGLRSLGLLSSDGIEAAFSDIEALAEHCRFSDCAHDREPGCAVHAAVADGTLTSERLAAYRKLQDEATAEAERALAKRDARGRR
ncbi:MAG: ribosome small subunit-dependent GTPase A [Acidimicrobiia bacterium]